MGGSEHFDLLSVTFVDILEVVIIPLVLNFGGVISPAVDEMDRTNYIIEVIIIEDLLNGGLILEVADFDAGFDVMVEFELSHKIKIVVQRVFELIFFKPSLLKLTDRRIIED